MDVGLVEGVVFWPVHCVASLAVRRVGIPETWRRAVVHAHCGHSRSQALGGKISLKENCISDVLYTTNKIIILYLCV
jgi:hypothetical protein